MQSECSAATVVFAISNTVDAVASVLAVTDVTTVTVLAVTAVATVAAVSPATTSRLPTEPFLFAAIGEAKADSGNLPIVCLFHSAL